MPPPSSSSSSQSIPRPRIYLLGPSSAGKTSSLRRYQFDYYSSLDSTSNLKWKIDELKFQIQEEETCGVDYISFPIQYFPQFNPVFFDFSGSANYSRIRTEFYSDLANSPVALFIFFDINSSTGLQSVSRILKEIQESPFILNRSLLFLFGTKIDLLGKNPRIQTTSESRKWANSNGFKEYFEISAKSGSGIREAFESAIELSRVHYKSANFNTKPDNSSSTAAGPAPNNNSSSAAATTGDSKESIRESIISSVVQWSRGRDVRSLLNEINQSKAGDELFLERHSGLTAVSASYRKALIIVHPDKLVNKEDFNALVRAEEMFKAINSAFEVFKKSNELRTTK